MWSVISLKFNYVNCNLIILNMHEIWIHICCKSKLRVLKHNKLDKFIFRNISLEHSKGLHVQVILNKVKIGDYELKLNYNNEFKIYIIYEYG